MAWPKAQIATVSLQTGDKATSSFAAVGTLPLKARSLPGARSSEPAGPQRLDIQVLDRNATKALGVEGVVLAVRGKGGSAGKVEVELDYSRFRHAYGGDWASRLTLRRLPACAVTTQTSHPCGPATPLGAHNDVPAGKLSGTLTLKPAHTASSGQALVAHANTSATAPQSLTTTSNDVTLLAATAAPAGAAGDFKAATLSPSGTWTAGGSSGAFSWSYDLDVPDVPGDLTPDLGLSYSSQSVDGRTAATNNQANWIGDGWSMEPGSVQRRYTPCMDDDSGGNNTTKVGDQCWKADNATLSLAGKSHELVKDDTENKDSDKSAVWHLKDDDGTRVEQLTNTDRGNGDNNGEYWRVTTPDGTSYYYGYNRLPGWSDGKTETNSTWTVPVFGNHPGEPCHQTAFADSWCQQAWRWNLDYVVDPHGNAMAYYWDKETNYYGRNVSEATGKSTATSYVRGGSLKRIEYGLRASAMYATNGAAATVTFDTSERCLDDCTTFDAAHAKNWPDVPFDQYCKKGDECKNRYSPSFWTRQRLTDITTHILVGSAYKTVDAWKLAHQFPSTGDGSDPALWLASIQRTGHTADPAITLPAVSFRGRQLANRVDHVHEEIPPLVRYRIYGIDTESGGTIGVTYSDPGCTATSLPQPDSNTTRCYPVMWSPPDSPGPNGEPYLDWFHSYVVTQVLEFDNTAGAPIKQTAYSYPGGTVWAKDQDPFTKGKYRTYGDQRGYARVQERVGAGNDKTTLTETRYFRGINGSKVPDSEGNATDDHEAFAGMPREEITYDGDTDKILKTKVTTPWRSAPTAIHARAGLPDLVAYMTDTKNTTTREAITGGAWRRTRTDNTFDDYGQITTSSETGDMAKTGDERCTNTRYARNIQANILDLVAEAKTVAVDCDATPTLPKDLVSVERSYYDGATTLAAPPTKGDVTRTDGQDAAGTGFLTTETRTHDTYGRVHTSTDATGATTTTDFTPATGAAPLTTVITNPLGHTETTQDDPARGTPLATIDANGKRTDATYDALGRLAKLWQPGWTKADHPGTPSTENTYALSTTTPNVVTTKALQYDAGYHTTYTLYDGLLRERETQTPAPGGGRLIAETRYDTHGWTWKTYNPYYAEGQPSATLVKAADNTIPNLTENTYDGNGRITAVISRKYGDETRRTTTTYGGDRTTVIPPKGATATTTLTDARGRTTELRQYTSSGMSDYQATTYTYDQHDKLAGMTDPAGNTWTYTQDARGRQISAHDPDKGTTTTTYDNADRPTTVTDARGTTLTTGYDALGRKTTLRQGSTIRARWTYDTLAKGQLSSETRVQDGKEYTSSTGGYNDRYQPTSTTVTVPGPQGTTTDYTFNYGYNTYTGIQEWTLNPALGGLPSERVTTVLSDGNLPQKTTAGSQVLVNQTSHDSFSRPLRTEYGGTLGKKLYKTQSYDEHTGDLIRQTTDRDTAPQRIDDIAYTYDNAGNITGLTTTSGQDKAKTTDTQCFTMDALRRLTEAWTTVKDCTTAPSTTTVGGPAPYWRSYTYDAVGNRKKETQHQVSGTTAGQDVTRNSDFPDTKKDRPHAVTAVNTQGGPANGEVDKFTYDEAGNLRNRQEAGRNQTFTWDAEGRLAAVTEDGKDTSYLYDTEGDRLLTHNSDGSTTLYLPNGNELKTYDDGSTVGTRYYHHGDDAVALRTSTGGLSYLFTDHQGTALTAVTATDQAITRRNQLPFGAPRTAQPATWPGTHGFVDGTQEGTGLTHIGAREYDPALGSFLSVDPLLDPDDPQQSNAYAYANNTPVTASDPDGQQFQDRETGLGYGNSTAHRNWYRDQGYTDRYGHPTRKYTRFISSYNKTWRSYYSSSWYRDYVSKGKDAGYGKSKPKPAPPKPKPWWEKAWNSASGWVSDNWDNIKTVATVAGFVTCLAASAGFCVGAGVVIATFKFGGDGMKTGNFDVKSYSKDLAWTLVGGGTAAAFGRAFGGAKSWSEAYWGSPLTRASRMYKTKIPGVRGVGGGRKTWTVDKAFRGPINWKQAYANMGINGAFNVGFCGADASSAGNLLNVMSSSVPKFC